MSEKYSKYRQHHIECCWRWILSQNSSRGRINQNIICSIRLSVIGKYIFFWFSFYFVSQLPWIFFRLFFNVNAYAWAMSSNTNFFHFSFQINSYSVVHCVYVFLIIFFSSSSSVHWLLSVQISCILVWYFTVCFEKQTHVLIFY